MALTSQQNIPKQPEVKEPWTFRRLFPLSSIGAISKMFVSPLEALLGYVVFIVGIAILAGRDVPVLFYGLSACLLGAVVYERLTRPVETKSKKDAIK
jgi:hypothetical protein